MKDDVISHRRPRRKRGSAWGWAARRFGALAVTLAALTAATWLAPLLPHPPAQQPAPVVEAAAPGAYKLPLVVKVAPQLIETPVELARAPRRARRGVPLDAAVNPPGEDFEVLSAAELASISQARE